jgi:hypothetical protein
MESTLLNTLVKQLGLPGLAFAVLLYAVRVLWRSHVSHKDDYKDMNNKMTGVVEKNTEALTTMSEAVRQLSGKI